MTTNASASLITDAVAAADHLTNATKRQSLAGDALTVLDQIITDCRDQDHEDALNCKALLLRLPAFRDEPELKASAEAFLTRMAQMGGFGEHYANILRQRLGISRPPERHRGWPVGGNSEQNLGRGQS